MGKRCQKCGKEIPEFWGPFCNDCIPSSALLRVRHHDFPPNLDPGYCGLGIETGKRDPWWKRMCQRHDRAFNELKRGKYQGSGMKVAGRAAVDVLGGMVAGAYLVVSGPLYFVGAVFGGLVRWGQLERRAKRVKPWIPGDDK